MALLIFLDPEGKRPAEDDLEGSRPSNFEQYDNDTHIKHLSKNDSNFPVDSFSNFGQLMREKLVYYDKTHLIPVLSARPTVKLFCRPRRFGKSLTASMLEYFHDYRYAKDFEELFNGLAVQSMVHNKTTKNGEYIVLKFDFSRNGPTVDDLGESINNQLDNFVCCQQANGLLLNLSDCDFGAPKKPLSIWLEYSLLLNWSCSTPKPVRASFRKSKV